MNFKRLSFLFGAACALLAHQVGAQNTPEKNDPTGSDQRTDPVSSKTVEKKSAEMTLTDATGRKLDVEVLAANGDVLKIRRMADEKEFDIKLAQLDASSAKRVQNWIDRTPEIQNFEIDFKVEKRLVNSDDFETASRIFKTSQWVYDIEMTNMTRNVLNDAIVQYRIIYDDGVEFSRTTIMPGKGSNQQEGDEAALPEMAFNERAEFTTPKVTLQTYRYEPLRGETEFERDKLVGIWIRVMKRGRIVDEFQSNPMSMHSLTWDDEEEIVIKDSFKDSFTTKAE